MPDLRNIPHFEQYLQPWAMEESAFNAAINGLLGIDLHAHAADSKLRIQAGEDVIGKPSVLMSDNGIAVVELVGAMTKYGSSMSSAPASVELKRTMRTLAADQSVKGIMLLIDSPGGSVAGTADLAEAVADANAVKPVAAYIEDTGCSAAYWVASQAGRVTSNAMANVGSIGTFGVLYDQSARFAAAGVKAIVIRAGEGTVKGAGTPGTEITAEQQAEFTRVANQLNDQFVAGVAKGRKITMDQARVLADARVHIGEHAKALGLTDGVETFDAAMAHLSSRITKSKTPPARSAGINPKETRMSDATQTQAADQPKAATIAELKASLKGSTAEFREKCSEDGLTLQAATSRWLEHVTAENEQLKAKAEKPGSLALPAGGGKPDAEASGDAIAQWNEALEAKVKTGMRRDKAVSQLVHEKPDLHSAFVEASNLGRKPRR